MEDHSRTGFLGGVDLGGSHATCVVGRGPDVLERIARFSTRGPAETLADIVGFFSRAISDGLPVAAIGVSAFGPLDRDPASRTYGRVLATPKPSWTGTDILGRLRTLDIPVVIDTDVNGAALAEGEWGAAAGFADYAYVTVGTGIGVGLVSGGRLVNGLGHPELGHYAPPRHSDDRFAGCCPFHGDCLEGLASGTALAARVHPRSPTSIGDDDPALDLVAHYLGHLCSVISFTISPRRIVFGGGVLARETLLGRVRKAARARIAGYLPAAIYAGDLADVVVRSRWTAATSDVTAGALGGLSMASRVAGERGGLSVSSRRNSGATPAPFRHE